MAKGSYPVTVLDCPPREEVMTAYFDRSPVCFRIQWTLGSVFSVELLMDSSIWEEDGSGNKFSISGRVRRVIPVSATPYSAQLPGRLETVERFAANIDFALKRGTMHIF
ncbi:MAG: hypothetical protein HYW90_03900 [Candidatus Sungbacteria bacterium]|nr:hypothetical protein [Candidatus Sungbacteria bacterium]